MVYRLLTEQPDRTILYARNATGSVQVFSGSGPVYSATLRDLTMLACMPELGPNPIVIADTHFPCCLDVVTVLISTPGYLSNRDQKDMSNNGFRRLDVPTCSVDEIRDMRRVVFPSLDSDAVERGLKLWGPNPRIVLKNANTYITSCGGARVDEPETLRKAKSVSTDRLARFSVGELSEQGYGGAHLLAHWRAEGQYASQGARLRIPAPGSIIFVASLSSRRLHGQCTSPSA